MEIKPQADRIMTALLQILNTLNNKSSVADSVFAAVGGLANALGEDFENYMSAFAPYLYKALGNKEEPGLCAMAIGLVSDITRALEEKALPYCNDFMNYLLDNLRVSSKPCAYFEIDVLTYYTEYRTQQPVQACYSSVLRRHRTSYWRKLRAISLDCRSSFGPSCQHQHRYNCII